MFRNLFDSEVILYSPEGRLLQIEYSKNASKNGNPLISFKSISHIITISLNQEISYFKKPNNKVYSFDDNIFIGMSGIIGDGKLIFDLLDSKINEYQTGNNVSMPICNLATICSKIFHTNTLYSGTRPLGIDILIGGYDKNGLNLYKITQDGYSDIEFGTAIGTESDINNKLLKKNNFDIRFLSIGELIYFTIRFIFGKKSKFIFFNYKVNQFFIKSFLYSEKLNK
jgi:20S proteasome subunit alpha 6